jgi:predicted nuclease of predicted toxin-antitoxin system
VKFLVDNQLPEALSRFLTSLGCDCVHVMEIGFGEAPDVDIWRYACESGRIVVTKDEDFLHFANREPKTGGVIWVRLGNCRTANLLAKFERLWPRIQASLEAGHRVIEIR